MYYLTCVGPRYHYFALIKKSFYSFKFARHFLQEGISPLSDYLANFCKKILDMLAIVQLNLRLVFVPYLRSFHH